MHLKEVNSADLKSWFAFYYEKIKFSFYQLSCTADFETLYNSKKILEKISKSFDYFAWWTPISEINVKQFLYTIVVKFMFLFLLLKETSIYALMSFTSIEYHIFKASTYLPKCKLFLIQPLSPDPQGLKRDKSENLSWTEIKLHQVL